MGEKNGTHSATHVDIESHQPAISARRCATVMEPCQRGPRGPSRRPKNDMSPKTLSIASTEGKFLWASEIYEVFEIARFPLGPPGLTARLAFESRRGY
jgi:hypothetical protein